MKEETAVTGECSVLGCFCHEAQEFEQHLTVEQCLSELREIFPDAQHIGIRSTLGWFAPNTVETLSRIVVSQYEWYGPTLTEAMTQVRKWREEQQ